VSHSREQIALSPLQIALSPCARGLRGMEAADVRASRETLRLLLSAAPLLRAAPFL
jgi:hypothetical protein